MVVIDSKELEGKKLPRSNLYDQHAEHCIACRQATKPTTGDVASEAMKCLHCGLVIAKPTHHTSPNSKPYIAKWENQMVLNEDRRQEMYRLLDQIKDDSRL